VINFIHTAETFTSRYETLDNPLCLDFRRTLHIWIINISQRIILPLTYTLTNTYSSPLLTARIRANSKCKGTRDVNLIPIARAPFDSFEIRLKRGNVQDLKSTIPGRGSVKDLRHLSEICPIQVVNIIPFSFAMFGYVHCSIE
jgi:hypothetical protein